MLQPQQTTVSVVLCTYNGAAFLAPQLDSILGQTYPLHELVVVDDGSTDGTWPLLQQYARQHPLMRLYQNEQNLGYNKNFEKALQLATGDVLAIADQDDIWHPEKIATLLRVWPAQCSLVYANSVYFQDVVPEAPQDNKLLHRLSGTDPRRLALYNSVSGHATLFRRSLLPLAVPFHPDIYYDWWLAVVAMCNGGVHFHPEILVYQRRHAHNASHPPISEDEIFIKKKQQMPVYLQQFAAAANMPPMYRRFFEELNQLWMDALAGKNQWQLFLFLMRYRHQLYATKRRKFPFITHLKRSYRYAFAAV